MPVVAALRSWKREEGMTRAVALTREPQAYPTLPGRQQRSDVERILTSVSASLSISAGQLRALLIMIQATRPSDWTNPDRDAVCYLRQMHVAEKLGVTTRAVRKHEVDLERKGLILRNLGADGSRGRFAGGEVIQGISFSPLISRLPELLSLLEDQENDRRNRLALSRKLSAAKRELSRTIAKLSASESDHTLLASFIDLLKRAPRNPMSLTTEALNGVFVVIDDAVRSAHNLLGSTSESSAEGEPQFLSHIQDTTEDYLESCSPPEEILCTPNIATNRNNWTESAAIDDDRPKAIKLSQAGKREGSLSQLMAPNSLYSVAGEDFQMYLDARRREGHPLTEYDFIQAAPDLLRDLDVQSDVWNEAVNVMGHLKAALSVLVIDANRRRSTNPIRQPGAMLRAMTRLARHDKLNLIGSLWALKYRSSQHVAGSSKSRNVTIPNCLSERN